MYHVSIKSPEVLKHGLQFIIAEVLLAFWKKLLRVCDKLNLTDLLLLLYNA